ncbi:cobalt/nickel transport system permease protein [Lutibacter agarilyticus]|uniref:Cobalt/nickel transport system permease protein n=1 Tax=Lutibacter agarilyticus TaxID=1109740 RepID=A0A238VHV8_9FLAO|nr:potassium channel family protein [Lutibacter agarilyticus]SNR33764.1 cobalt/nickel transport system permease protein [Lutibacter agarilyticus]
MVDKMYSYRFELFFFSLTTILFGAVFFPNQWFEDILSPILFIINFLSGILMISKIKKLRRFFLFLLVVIMIVFYRSQVLNDKTDSNDFIRLAAYFVFYTMVTSELIKQVWKSKIITKNIIIGLMSGYICIGLLGFFMFLTIEISSPGSFNGVSLNMHQSTSQIDSFLYFSYITLLTIGYGEITPVTLIAQKATILTGLVGQFYMVILTAIIVGKYISQTVIKEK